MHDVSPPAAPWQSPGNGEADPFELFAVWFRAAAASEASDPNAMALATCDRDGQPNVRMVLMKDFGSGGFVFYTNAESRKGDELSANSGAAAVLHWKSVHRQVRFRGPVEHVDPAAADAYFRSRARQSQIGAWASQQSRPLESRAVLEEAVRRETSRFSSAPVPRPAYWIGYRIVPLYLEFWTEGPFRLHHRLVFEREKPEAPWHAGELYP
jgi:pyridoxamine 5'-phosphate oxidase